MKRMTLRIAILAAMAAGLAVSQAAAWGPRAQQSITIMALQVIKLEHPSVLRPGGITGTHFEKDVLRGSLDGYSVIADVVPLNNDIETVQAIATEIQLLRDARLYGPSSYFAYRLGVLASLVSNVITPYGFAWTPDEREIRRQMFRDIDNELDNYGFKPSRKYLIFVRDVDDYFKKQRGFYEDDKRLIADDYRRGRGFEGFLSEGGRAYFERCIEATADVWHTVLRPEPDAAQVQASKPLLTWYFVKEVEYLLNVKDNLHQANQIYQNFEKVNPGIAAAYETLGDHYYNYGRDRDIEDAVERGVREWIRAHSMGGPERNRVSEKLCEHFLKQGEFFKAKAQQPGSDDNDLPTALAAFEKALEYKRTSQEAADRIQETNVLITQRRQRYEMTVNIIATGERVREEAEKARTDGDLGNAIKTFRQAITFYQAVDDEFRELSNNARESIRKLNLSVSNAINEVLDRASDAVDQGERAKEEHRYEDAIAAYETIPLIVDVIPEDISDTVTGDKQNMITLAETKVQEAKVAKLRYEEAQRAQAEAAQAGGRRGGG